MSFRSNRDARDRVSGGLLDALRLLKLEKRRPTDADRPPVIPMPGRKVRPHRGQLDLDGNEVQ